LNEATTNEELTGTPFRIVHIPEHGWFITLGMQRISSTLHKTRAEAIKPVHERDWFFICNAIVTILEQVGTIKNIEQDKAKPTKMREN
jgi:hypothetical protein